MNEYLTVLEPANGEYTEKRSKFISGIYPCRSEQEATEILSKVKSENFGANHNVYAYVLDNNNISRFSDDGEPHGTAGRPVLEVIEGKGLKNIIIIVTRYFGGVLLGTGGLVRSYTSAAKNAVENAEIYKMCECTVCSVKCEYSDHARLVSVIENSGATINDTVFTDKVTVKFSLLSEIYEKLKSEIIDTFSGRIDPEIMKIGVFPIKNQKL